MGSCIWIFGMGYWAKILIPKIISQFNNHQINVIDINLSSLEFYKFSQYKLVKLSDIDHFNLTSKKGDIVFICTPPQNHFEIAELALKNECHVWVEKPLCLSSIQAEELYLISQNNNTTLFSVHLYLYHT